MSDPPWPDPDRCLDHRLLVLAGSEPWRIRDAIEGTQIFGGSGSGKSSGSGRTIAKAFIEAGFGGLVLTAKPDDLEQWIKYLRESARLTDQQICDRVVVIEPETGGTDATGTRRRHHPSAIWPRRYTGRYPQGTESRDELELPICRGFNFLEYEFRASEGLTQDLVSLFMNAMSAGGPAVSASDPYWDDALRELLTHTIDLAAFGTEAATGTPTIRLEDIDKIIRTAPPSQEAALSTKWRDREVSLCWRYLELANEKLARTGRLVRTHGAGRASDLANTVDYWLHDFPSLTERTRSIVVSSFTSKASGLLHSPLKGLLCSADAPAVEATPEWTHKGKIVIVYLPIKLYGEVGRFAQVILKTVWQRATERRVKKLHDNCPSQRPVFLWSDESQNFITKEDALFQQTARSALAATVYLTQNISNYYTALGGDSAHAAADSLLGNLQTKIFHANGDPATNEWAGRLFGSWATETTSRDFSTGLPQSRNSTAQSLLLAAHFASLRKGGDHREVDAYVFQAGRPWSIESRLATKSAIARLGDSENGPLGMPPHILFHSFRQQD